MFLFKHLSVLVLLVSLSTAVFAQNRSRSEMSAEEYYLQENSIEMMIIRETSRSDNAEQKLIALNYIKEAIDNGNTGPDVRQALEYLSVEGTQSVARENGRVVNNFPHIRRRSAEYLGLLKTEEARQALLTVCRFENEPMVLMEAIKSLGNFGVNDNNDTITTIVRAVSHFDYTNPDNLLALAAIDAFEKIAKANEGITDPEAIRLLIRISDGPYIISVRERARQTVSALRFPRNN
jgi:HEAT repeat protein